jgi:hypothetical protein
MRQKQTFTLPSIIVPILGNQGGQQDVIRGSSRCRQKFLVFKQSVAQSDLRAHVPNKSFLVIQGNLAAMMHYANIQQDLDSRNAGIENALTDWKFAPLPWGTVGYGLGS